MSIGLWSLQFTGLAGTIAARSTAQMGSHTWSQLYSIMVRAKCRRRRRWLAFRKGTRMALWLDKPCFFRILCDQGKKTSWPIGKGQHTGKRGRG